VGDHPWVAHQTCVNYQDAKVISLKTLYELKDKGYLKLQDPLAPAVLRRVLEGAALSARMSMGHAAILSDQGLIEI
jgi:hypothetical protein